MARLPDEVIEQLKSGVDLVSLVEAAGVVLERDRADLRRTLPVPRRPHPFARRHAGEGPLALPRGLPGRRHGRSTG